MFQDLINEALETGRPYIKEGEVATYIRSLEERTRISSESAFSAGMEAGSLAGIRRTGSASRVFRRLSALR